MMYKNEKGVTLAALVIVIIVMLMLAGTTASLGINGGGLVSRTYNAVNEWNQSYEEDKQRFLTR